MSYPKIYVRLLQSQGMDNIRNEIEIGGTSSKTSEQFKRLKIHYLNRILASQNRFQSFYDEIFNINRLQSSNSFSMRLIGILIILILVY